MQVKYWYVFKLKNTLILRKSLDRSVLADIMDYIRCKVSLNAAGRAPTKNRSLSLEPVAPSAKAYNQYLYFNSVKYVIHDWNDSLVDDFLFGKFTFTVSKIPYILGKSKGSKTKTDTFFAKKRSAFALSWVHDKQ